MKKETRLVFNQYLQGVATDNAADISEIKSGDSFSVTPSVQQKLESVSQQSHEFLKRINIVPVVENQGEVLGLGVSSTIAGTTDTSTTDRQTAEIHNFVSNRYHCQQINYDSHINYSTLDSWAKFNDFERRLGQQKAVRIALDRIMIGFNGKERAKTSNRQTNPLLQDVAKGWLAKIEENAAKRVFFETKKSGGKVEIGSDGEFKNLDSLVYAAVTDLIDEQYQDDTNLVAIVSRDLMSDKYFPLLNQETPTEQVAGAILTSTRRIGGLTAVQVPFMPKGTILITRLDNLSIYYQEGGMRRTMRNNPVRDRYEDFLSSNDDFVIENYNAVALIKNITVKGDVRIPELGK